MTKLMKKTPSINIDSNINKAFKVIDSYLPKHYTELVKEICPDANSNTIRIIRKRKSGDVQIIAALKKVAERTRRTLNN